MANCLKYYHISRSVRIAKPDVQLVPLRTSRSRGHYDHTTGDRGATFAIAVYLKAMSKRRDHGYCVRDVRGVLPNLKIEFQSDSYAWPLLSPVLLFSPLPPSCFAGVTDRPSPGPLCVSLALLKGLQGSSRGIWPSHLCIPYDEGCGMFDLCWEAWPEESSHMLDPDRWLPTPIVDEAELRSALSDEAEICDFSFGCLCRVSMELLRLFLVSWFALHEGCSYISMASLAKRYTTNGYGNEKNTFCISLFSIAFDVRVCPVWRHCLCLSVSLLD